MTDKVLWNDKQYQFFKNDFMRYELQRVIDARSSLEKRWIDWLTLYRVPKPGPDGWVCDFPFEGAPAYTYPVARMSVDPTKAKYIQSIHATPNIWSLSPLNERWVKVVKPLQDYLQWIDWNMLHMWDVNNRVVGEMLKLGTGIYKTGWRYQRNRTTGYDANMRRAQVIRELNQPEVNHVHLTNFLIPPEAWEIDADMPGGARWVAERWRPRPSLLRALAKGQAPFLPDYDKEAVERVLKFQEVGPPDYERRIAELDDQPNVEGQLQEKPVELYECWVRFDTTGNGVEDDIVVIFHKETRECLRAIYNPWSHGKRPYHAIRYKRGDGFYGIGLCERAEMHQRLQSDLLNADIAASILRNAPMWSVAEGSSFQPGDPVFPGRVVTHRMGEEIKPLFMVGGQPGDIRNLIGLADNIARQDTGVTDLNSGMIGQVPSRTPATTVTSLLQESQTHIDMSLKDARYGGLSRIGLQVLQLVQQQVGNVVNNPNGQAFLELSAWVLGQPESQFVNQALQIPQERIELGIGVEITATSSANNKELQKQNFLAMMQILEQRAPQILQMAQVAQQAANTPLGMIAVDLLRGEQELMTRLMEQFDVRNPEDIIPDITTAMASIAPPEAGTGALGGPALVGPSPFGAPGIPGTQGAF